MMNMSEYRIPLSYLVLNRQYIYIDSDYKVEFVCIPLEDMNDETDLSYFLRTFIASLRFDSSENGDYVAKILTYVNDEEMFNLLGSIARKDFNLSQASLLPPQEKIKLAKMMRYDYNASDSQIQRLLKLDLNVVRELFPR